MAYMGNLTVANTSSWSCSADFKIAARFQAPSTFVGKRMGVYLSTGLGSGEYGRLGIYNDSAGEPSTLIRTTVTFQGRGLEGWHHQDLSLDIPTISSGSYYWLAFATDGAGVGGFGASGGSSRSNSDLFANNMATPFGSASSGTVEMCIYIADEEDPPFLTIADLSAGGAVMTASTGAKVAVIPTTLSGVEIYRNINLPQPYLADSNGWADIWGSGGTFTPGSFDAAIDSNDNIHMVASCDTEETRDVAYAVATYSGGNWTIGAWEEVLDYTQSGPNYPGCAISIDSNDYPHVLCVDIKRVGGSSQDNVYYTERTSGSWSTPLQMGPRSVKTYYYNHPQIMVRNSDNIEIVYVSQEISIAWAEDTYTGSWAGQTRWAELADITNTEITHTIAATTGGTVYRTVPGYSPNEIFINDSSIGSWVTHANRKISRMVLVGTDRYIFYLDTSNDISLLANTGSGWTSLGAIKSGTYTDVIAEWAYNNEHQVDEMNYIYEESGAVFYDAYSLLESSRRIFITHV
jgi:hypothetical protein